MSSQVVTRPMAGDSNAASRAYAIPGSNPHGTQTQQQQQQQLQQQPRAGGAQQPNGVIAGSANGATSYASRRAPPTSTHRPAPTMYRVDRVNVNGKDTEVLTIMDTPEPDDDINNNGNVYRVKPQYDVQSHVSSNKRRKSDGAHISDNPYGASTIGSSNNATSARQQPLANTHTTTTTATTTATSSNKRKHAADSTADSRATQKAKVDPKDDANAICDKEGHYIVRPETLLSGEYRIIKQLGQGTFGKVVAAENIKTRQHVAIKIIRNVDKYREAAKMEIAVLKKLERGDAKNKFKCIQLLECFVTHGHHCLVSELLGQSVFDFLKENSYAPFPLSHVQSFARQLLSSVTFVHRMDLIHTDLKPENILLEYNDADIVPTRKFRNRKILQNTSIRLIDFGSATGAKDYHASVVSTRHYRAPEIILGLGWSFPCDAWSIGCILVEFLTGEALFQTHENLEHLAMMVKVFGPMPRRFAQKAERAVLSNGHQGWFKNSDAGPSVNFPREDTSKQSRKFVAALKPLDHIVPNDGSYAIRKFIDLCSQLLKWDPNERLSPTKALHHDFFKLDIQDDGSGSVMPLIPDDI
ncbi:serine threonine protein kinase CMGC group [Microbotryomycetes sp. JL221]|nr:serine threonine protein kinase CMGC group [Microbotryomycetes sp. JL221]